VKFIYVSPRIKATEGFVFLFHNVAEIYPYS